MRRTRLLIGLVVALAVAGGAAPAGAGAYVYPPIKHVFVIVLENQDFSMWYTAGQSSAPYLSRTLPSEGALDPDYFGVGHSSLDNYIAMISGQPPTADTKNDCPDPLTDVPTADSGGIAQGNGCVYPAKFKTIADQLAGAGLSWRGYMQNLPSNCSLDASGADGYARKHNPFVFFHSLRDSGQCAAGDVPLDQLPADLQSVATTPNYVFISPDQCHDGHTDCIDSAPDPVEQEASQLKEADGFLQQYVPMITASPAYRQDGLLAVVFDEGIDTLACCGESATDPDGSIAGSQLGLPGAGGGQTGAIFLSRFIKPGTIDSRAYNHYSLLRSSENELGVGYLGEAGSAQAFGSDLFTNWFPPTASGGGTGGSGGSAGGSAGSGSGGGGTSGAGGGSNGLALTGAAAPLPAACRRYRPTITALHAGRIRGAVKLYGRATEPRCARAASVGRITAVFVSIARISGHRCASLTRRGRLTRLGSCRHLRVLAARGGARWTLTIHGRPPAGRYLLVAVAQDGAGRVGPVRYRRIRLRRAR